MLSDTSSHQPAFSTTPDAAAADAITPANLLKHIEVLASDAFEGRAPGTRGEDLSVEYIAGQFKALGLQPGNPDGTYFQEVPLAGIRSAPQAAFSIPGTTINLNFPDEFVAGSEHLMPHMKVKFSELVFVGYGVVAPEYGWDDYKDVDVRGKTLLMLINDPAIPDPNDPSKLDNSMFKGKEMTYYGRWTYKYEIAARKGAAAAVIIHETGPAGYPYSVVKMSWGKENLTIDAADKNAGTVPIRSWITEDVARKLCGLGGHDLAEMKKAALSRDFRPMNMGVFAHFDVNQAVRPFKSRNVVAALPGTNPDLANQWIVYTAHWDHLGKQTDESGTRIFRGAVDNASGVAALLSIAQAFTRVKPGPERSILFMAPTAEEAGLLGARYYAEHPFHPLTNTLANINIDGVSVYGKASDLEDLSNFNSTLDDMLEEAAARQGRTLKPSSRLETGLFYRADHFEFAKVGVPVLYAKGGIDLIGKPAGRGDELETEYITNRYHKPEDQILPEWDLSGAAQDMQLLFQVGWAAANGAKFPEWKPASEFRARRDEMLARG